MVSQIKIALADDHKIFRRGVVASMRQYDNLDFMLEATNGQDLLDQMQLNLPDVVLCDLKMPIKDGIDVTKIITVKHPTVRVLILTMYEDDRFIQNLMDSGAAGYLTKNTEASEIYKAINEVMKKGFYLTPFINRILIKRNYNKQKFSPSLNNEIVITDKEKEVLSLVALEYTASEIAEKLIMSHRTVEAIKERLMERFSVKNSVGLIYFAMKNRLLE
jgi:DNA-binding NarL/FixJ family response regulator